MISGIMRSIYIYEVNQEIQFSWKTERRKIHRINNNMFIWNEYLWISLFSSNILECRILPHAECILYYQLDSDNEYELVSSKYVIVVVINNIGSMNGYFANVGFNSQNGTWFGSME